MTMTDSQHLDQDQLSALVDDRLEPAERARADQHLDACPRCRAELDGLQATVSLLRRLPERAPPRSFLLAESARPPLALRLAPWTRAAGALAAALFVVLLSADILGLGGATSIPRAPAPASAPAASMTARPATGAADQAAQARPAEAPKAAAPAPKPAAPAQERNAKVAESAPAVTQAPAIPLPAAPAELRAVVPTAAPTSAAPTLAPTTPPRTEPQPAPQPPAGAAGGSPLRPWQVATGALAVILLIASIIMRKSRAQA